ncbi:MAG: hypothetical protein RLO52_36885 [Sandaracinaceae bacterium]|nr:MAG: hypothetical protein EVA89_39680 [Sandaracinaceae bacterium]HBQ11466.1 hypothetical protein [Myxococcales bacterium]
MALIECPDCERKVSDRAQTCPDCACPVAEVVAEQRAEAARAEAVGSREVTQEETDCPPCKARGFVEHADGRISWCAVCEHSGRVTLCLASDGFYAVARYATDRFVEGELHPDSSGVVFHIGEQKPPLKYKAAGERHAIKPEEIPW